LNDEPGRAKGSVFSVFKEATPVSGSVLDHPALSPLPERESESAVDELLVIDHAFT
jgi:hypothetical protein